MKIGKKTVDAAEGLELPELPENMFWRVAKDSWDEEYLISVVDSTDPNELDTVLMSRIVDLDIVAKIEKLRQDVRTAEKEYLDIKGPNLKTLLSGRNIKQEKDYYYDIYKGLNNQRIDLDGTEGVEVLTSELIHSMALSMMPKMEKIVADMKISRESAAFVGDYPPLKLSELRRNV